MLQRLLFLSFILCFFTHKTPALNKPSERLSKAVIDTGKVSSAEAQAGYHHQRTQKRQVRAHKKRSSLPRQRTHYGKRLRALWKTMKPKEDLRMLWWGLGILGATLLAGTGLLVEILGLFWAAAIVGALALLAMVLPLIDDIGIKQNFVLGAMLFFFGMALGWLSIGLLGFWATNAALFKSGVFVIVWSLVGFAFAIAFYLALYFLWKLIKAFFRLMILIFTFGLVDIDK